MSAQTPSTAAAVDLTTLSRDLGDSLPPLDEGAQRVSLALYRALAKGQPATVEDLASETGMPSAETIAELLETWPAVYREGGGAVTGYWGLSLAGGAHRIRVRGVELTTWCAYDTLFLPELFQCEVEIFSHCPETKSEVRLRVGPDRIVETEPDTMVLSFVDPRDRIGEDVISAFCQHIHFFRDRESGERWARGRTGALLLSLEEGFTLAHDSNRRRYPLFFSND